MRITDLIAITELARLTKKSRPTIYKYCNDFDNLNYDTIPYSFLILLQKVASGDFNKQKIIEYCNAAFCENNSDDKEISEIINIIYKNKDKIDLRKIKKIVLEEIENDNK